MDRKLLGRFLAVFCFAFELPLIASDQIIWVENNGAFTITHIDYPLEVTTAWFWLMIGLAYLSVAQILALYDRDFMGRKVGAKKGS